MMHQKLMDRFREILSASGPARIAPTYQPLVQHANQAFHTVSNSLQKPTDHKVSTLSLPKQFLEAYP